MNIIEGTKSMETIVQKDLSDEIKTARESQLKFAYYVIGLAVASIGYSVNQTNGKSIAWSQIPLLISMLLFFACIALGFAYIRTLNASMQMDIMFFQEENNIEALEVDEDRKYELKMEVYEKRQQTASELSTGNIKRFKHQQLCFLWAIFLFTIWRILEMYLLSSQ
jgi:hypothetical protein